MNWRIDRMSHQKTLLVDASQAILQQAENEKRDLTDSESAKLKTQRTEIDKLQAQISEATATAIWAKTVAPIPNEGLQLDMGYRAAGGRLDVGHGPGGGMCFHNGATGEMVRALLPGQSFCTSGARQVGDGEPNYAGRVLHSWLTGRTDNPSFQAAAMQGNIDTAGGYLLGAEPQSDIRRLRPRGVGMSPGGAQTVPMTVPELHLTRAATDPTAYWRGEGVAVTATVRNLERVKLIVRTLACIIPISIELLEDASNAPALLEDAMSKAMGLKLDQAALAGTGAGAEPLGVRNISGTNTVTSVGTPTDYSNASSAVKKILQANYPGEISKLAWIQNPRDAATYDGLQDTLHQPLRPTPWVAQLSSSTRPAWPSPRVRVAMRATA